jgi:hypothetical protein
MNELTVKGTVVIDTMKFHEIEGGFGQNRKSMLVKEIAEIHGKTLSAINQAINMNLKRFKSGIDFVDLKGTQFVVNLIDSGIYTQNALNASANVYILSERGYAKLLKILEDDLAWEKYDQLVDGYFTMRKVIKEDPDTLEAVRVESAKERARAMLLNAQNRAFKTLMSTIDDKQLSPIAVQVFGLTAIEQVTGQKIDYRPEFEKSWTATALSSETGLCPSTIGKIAVQSGLKSDEFGKAILNHVPGQAKQVPEFHYNAKGRELLLGAVEKWKSDHGKKPSQRS